MFGFYNFFFKFLDAHWVNSLNLKLCSKQYNKKIILNLIVVPQLRGGWQLLGQWAVYVFSYVYEGRTTVATLVRAFTTSLKLLGKANGRIDNT